MSFQACLDNIEAKTGKKPQDLRRMTIERGPMNQMANAGVIIEWLAQSFGLGRGHAMAIVACLRGRTE